VRTAPRAALRTALRSALRTAASLQGLRPLFAVLLATCLPFDDSRAQEETTTDADATDAAEVLCLSLPRIAVADAAPVVSAFSETLREQIAAFVGGPLLEPRPMTSRVPAQIRAEAAQEGCRYLLNVTFTHHPQSKIGRRTAQTAITVGSAATQLGAVSSSASGALGAASTISGLFGGEDDHGGPNGSGIYPLGKNDRVALEYALEPVKRHEASASQSRKFEGKAAKDNDPQVEALVEQAANAIADTLLSDQAAAQ